MPAFLAVLARVAAFLQSAPLTSEPQFPPKYRIAAAALVALAFVGLQPRLTPASLVLTLPAEIMLGLIAGFSARLVLAGVETGGELIGLQMGLGFASTFDPKLGESALPMRRLAFALAAMAFVSVGGIQVPARLAALPTAPMLTLLDAFNGLLQRGAEVMVLGVRIATPVLVAVTVANIAMGLANRAAPALNVFSVMLTVTGLMGAFIMITTAPALAHELVTAGQRAVLAALGEL